MRFPPPIRVRRRRPRGFVLIMAIVLTGIVAITLAVLAAGFTMQSSRTHMQSDDAQLRQLLSAGEEIARSRLGRSSPVDAVVALPASLDGAGATLTLQPVSDADHAGQSVEISATLGKRRASQSVRFAQRGGEWSLASAVLN